MARGCSTLMWAEICFTRVTCLKRFWATFLAALQISLTFRADSSHPLTLEALLHPWMQGFRDILTWIQGHLPMHTWESSHGFMGILIRIQGHPPMHSWTSSHGFMGILTWIQGHPHEQKGNSVNCIGACS